MDFTNMISQMPAAERSQAKIGVFTDPNVAKLDVMKIVEESLLQEGLNFVVWDKVSVEPTDHSWQVIVNSGSCTERVGRDRLCKVFKHHALPCCRRRVSDGHRQGCESVHELSRGGHLRVHQCAHRSREADREKA